mmetsp:Transcript_63900/g.195424  ORF Transcript_63900/g.195424 Transcript_63900/m.195424 type:complete len:206 (+) Transcript_63900:345-962(+)
MAPQASGLFVSGVTEPLRRYQARPVADDMAGVLCWRPLRLHCDYACGRRGVRGNGDASAVLGARIGRRRRGGGFWHRAGPSGVRIHRIVCLACRPVPSGGRLLPRPLHVVLDKHVPRGFPWPRRWHWLGLIFLGRGVYAPDLQRVGQPRGVVARALRDSAGCTFLGRVVVVPWRCEVGPVKGIPKGVVVLSRWCSGTRGLAFQCA